MEPVKILYFLTNIIFIFLFTYCSTGGLKINYENRESNLQKIVRKNFYEFYTKEKPPVVKISVSHTDKNKWSGTHTVVYRVKVKRYGRKYIIIEKKILKTAPDYFINLAKKELKKARFEASLIGNTRVLNTLDIVFDFR